MTDTPDPDPPLPPHPMRWRLTGLTEAELFQGYMHPVEAVALGGVLAATLAMLCVCWQGVAL